VTVPEPRYEYVDISVPISPGMVTWPSDPPVVVEPFKAIARGDRSNVSHLHMGTHTGSHVDAPLHFGLGDRGVDQLPLDALIGPAAVVDVREARAVTPEHVSACAFRVPPRSGISLDRVSVGISMATKDTASGERSWWGSNEWESRFRHYAASVVNYSGFPNRPPRPASGAPPAAGRSP